MFLYFCNFFQNSKEWIKRLRGQIELACCDGTALFNNINELIFGRYKILSENLKTVWNVEQDEKIKNNYNMS